MEWNGEQRPFARSGVAAVKVGKDVEIYRDIAGLLFGGFCTVKLTYENYVYRLI